MASRGSGSPSADAHRVPRPDFDVCGRARRTSFRYVSRMAEATSTRKRSIVKAITYRFFIVCLDFLVIYLFTHKVDVAVGFMIVSNIYTTVGYFAHERIWARIRWGRELTRTG